EELLHTVGASGIPILDRELVAHPDNAHFQIIANMPEPKLIGGDTFQEAGHVGITCRGIVFLNAIAAIATAQDVDVVAGTAFEGVVAAAPVEHIVAPAAVEDVVAAVSGQAVVE